MQVEAAEAGLGEKWSATVQGRRPRVGLGGGGRDLRKSRFWEPLEVTSSGALGKSRARKTQENLGREVSNQEVSSLRHDRTQVCVGLVGQGSPVGPHTSKYMF